MKIQKSGGGRSGKRVMTMVEHKRGQCADFEMITQEKYLQYFLSAEEHALTDEVMVEFLNDMVYISERLPLPQTPIQILEEITNKLKLNDSVLNSVTRIAHGILIECLTEAEIFTLMRFISCRNLFTYEDGIYVYFANNGTIGKFIECLAVLSQ